MTQSQKDKNKKKRRKEEKKKRRKRKCFQNQSSTLVEMAKPNMKEKKREKGIIERRGHE